MAMDFSIHWADWPTYNDLKLRFAVMTNLRSALIANWVESRLAANIAGTPFLSDSGITRQLVEARGRGLQCSRMQLQAIKDKNITPRAKQALLDMIELQKAHQEKIDKIQREIDLESRR
ncbi:hypothetical protein HYALB_00010895 [Hymenoscyphus albidus]|uniref:Uncharacterized protein n=1 Tax=Hymenoscyphus albidus TaxID=595503 RepID=A0A9N9LQD1_9HELO|nr:hypothetical protein HYALB_00010895 [Hymenoscyphus albidus]